MLATGSSGSNNHVTGTSSTVCSSSSAAERALAIDHIQVLLRKESSNYACIQLYTGDAATVAGCNIKTLEEGWRRRICEWAFEVTDHYCFDREVTSIAIYYLDRFVSYTIAYGETVGKREFQLLAITCLYVAMKLHGTIDLNLTTKRVRIPLSNFVELSHGYFSAVIIEEMEMKLLSRVLMWRTNPPTSAQFIAYILQLLAPTFQHGPRMEVSFSKLFDVTRFLTETAVCVSTVFVVFKPSVIALAALTIAVEAADDAAFSPHERHELFSKLTEVAFHFKSDAQEINRVRTLLAKLCPDVHALFLDDNEAANDNSTSAPESPPSRSTSESESFSGKRSPDCVSQLADDVCNRPPSKRHL